MVIAKYNTTEDMIFDIRQLNDKKSEPLTKCN